jgi:hypothetical protein
MFPGKRAGGGRGWLRSDVERWLQGGGSGNPGNSIASPARFQIDILGEMRSATVRLEPLYNPQGLRLRG